MAYLTRQEKCVVAFLVFGAICGLSYSYYKKFYPPIDIRFRRSLDYKTSRTEELDTLLKEAKSVNINQAPPEELMKLKGIGPALAYRIVEYRASHGSFKDIDELKNVPGIGLKKFDAIKDCVSLE